MWHKDKEDVAYIFVLEVEHPSLDGNVIEIEAPDFTMAVMLIARRLPGVHVKRVLYEYPRHIARASA